MESLTNLLKHIIFSVALPENYKYGFQQAIFLRRKHLELQGEGVLSFYILHDQKKMVLGHCHFHVSGSSASSPARATFGGIEISDNLDLRILWAFVAHFEKVLKEKGIDNIAITLPPGAHNFNRHTKVFDTFLNCHYHIEKSEISAVINVKDEEFRNNISGDMDRRLKQSKKKGWFLKKDSLEQLNIYYHLIYTSRKQKKYDLSMNFERLQKTASTFPEDFLLFGLYHDEEIIAASICIKVSDEILYNFYSAHDNEYSKWSPIVMLIEFIHKYCQQSGFTKFDLGTSALEKGPNFPLVHFKEHLGAELSPKLTFTKKLI